MLLAASCGPGSGQKGTNRYSYLETQKCLSYTTQAVPSSTSEYPDLPNYAKSGVLEYNFPKSNSPEAQTTYAVLISFGRDAKEAARKDKALRHAWITRGLEMPPPFEGGDGNMQYFGFVFPLDGGTVPENVKQAVKRCLAKARKPA
jgi:hypothetical protein